MAYVKGYQFKNVSATQAGFDLGPGRYGISVTATFSAGTVKLTRLAADGSTWVTVSTYTAATYETQDLMYGTYRFEVTTATAVYAELSPVVMGE